jgi:HEAT repeat protein
VDHLKMMWNVERLRGSFRLSSHVKRNRYEHRNRNRATILTEETAMSKSSIYIALFVAVLASCATPALAQTVAAQQDEPKLIAVLQSPDASQKDKMDACRQLAIIGGKDSIAPLAELLGDEKLSHMARYALEPNPDPAVDQALRDALGKVKGGPLVGVIGSLGVRRDAQAVPALAKLLGDSDAVVARAAARALGSIGNAPAAAALQEALPKASAGNRLDTCEGLLRCAEKLAAAGQEREAIAIYDQLRKLDGPHQVRAGALRGAILTRGKGGVALLKENLRSSDYILFSTAVQTAQVLPDSDVTKALTEGMGSLPPDNQILIIQTLGRRGDRRALPALFAAAKTGPKPVRLAALDTVTELGDASAVPVLVQLLDDADREISRAAQENLAALPGPQADAAVVALFDSGDRDKQTRALDLMERRRMTDAVPALLKAARAGDATLRPAAIRTVGDLGGPEQLPVLLDLLAESQQPQELTAVEQALSSVCTKAEDPAAQVRTLVARCAQAEPAQRTVLLRLLSVTGGPEALQTVRAAVNSDNAEVRAAAIRALGTWKTQDAAPLLLSLAKDAQDPSEKTLLLRNYLGCAGRGNLPVEQRLDMCRQAAGLVQRDEEKKLLLGTLGTIESPETFDLVLPYLDEPGTRREAEVAVVILAERMLRGRGAARDALAPKLIEPLEKVVQGTDDASLGPRARTLLERARNRTGGQQ